MKERLFQILMISTLIAWILSSLTFHYFHARHNSSMSLSASKYSVLKPLNQ